MSGSWGRSRAGLIGCLWRKRGFRCGVPELKAVSTEDSEGRFWDRVHRAKDLGVWLVRWVAGLLQGLLWGPGLGQS